MECEICSVRIVGLDVKVILTDDPETLGQGLSTNNAAVVFRENGVKIIGNEFKLNGENGENDENELLSFGKYDVSKCKIWLDTALALPVLRSQLFHEVYEFTLGYFSLVLSPGDEHGGFMRFTYLLYGVCMDNVDILFGDKLASFVER